MTGLRGGDHHLPASVLRLHAYSIAIALAAALAITLTVLAVVLATAGGGNDATEPVRVAPSASSSGTVPPSPAERAQPPGHSGPGMRP
jgi:hypothetical protein